jgi:hypothetical protein
VISNDTPMDTPSQDVNAAPEPANAGLRAQMSELGKRKRRPRLGHVGSPAFERSLVAMVDGLEHRVLLVRYRRELRAELKAATLSPSGEIVEMTVRSRALYQLHSAFVFAEQGGPVHRRHRRLHQMVEQLAESQAAYMAMRRRCGLDAETVTHAMSFSDAYRQLTLEKDDMPDMAETMRAARERLAPLEAQRAVERENATRKRIAEQLRAAGVAAPFEPVSMDVTPEMIELYGDIPEAWDIAVRKHAKPIPAAPVSLLEGPAPAMPAPTDEPPEPAEPLVLAPDVPRSVPDPVPDLEPAVEDLGVLRSRVVVADEPRFQPLRNARIPGTNCRTDEDGFVIHGGSLPL